jgi:hypothetical protein
MKKLTIAGRAELLGRLDILRKLGHVWPVPSLGNRDPYADYAEWEGSASDGAVVSIGCVGPAMLEYLKSRSTPDCW